MFYSNHLTNSRLLARSTHSCAFAEIWPLLILPSILQLFYMYRDAYNDQYRGNTYPIHFPPYDRFPNYRPAIEYFTETMSAGVYILQGPQMNVCAKLTHPLSFFTLPSPQLEQSQNRLQPSISKQSSPAIIQPGSVVPPTMMVVQAQAVIQANIQVCGMQVQRGHYCCMIWTIILGSLLLFPILMIYCMWWTEYVSPKYELDIKFYRAIGTFLKRERRCKILNITVIDNAFNGEKARALYQSLQGSSLTEFMFKNVALPVNYHENELDSFVTNMTPIKSLPFSSQMGWLIVGL